MSSAPNPFVTGGAIPPLKAFYVERAADRELLEACRRGQMAYVLGSRQTGKSSLLARARLRLRQEGALCAFVDLTGIGPAIDRAEWIKAILYEISDCFDLAPAEDCLEEAAAGDPALALVTFLETIVLPQRSGKIVIFIDELDLALRTGFAVDLLTGIRRVYGRQESTPRLKDVSFVLSGVALPDSLKIAEIYGIFRYGVSIDPQDFTPDELRGAASFLPFPPGDAARALERAHYWTSGQPYLTMLVCYLAAERAVEGCSEAMVDEIVEANLLTRVERDSNLRFVAGMLAGYGDEVLLLYRRILRGASVNYEPTEVKDRLRLSGVVRIENGALAVRNRIYRQVFDDHWIGRQLGPQFFRRFFN